eukprot:scaffold8336_cov94-Isochrysis_galbana.AAC.1
MENMGGAPSAPSTHGGGFSLLPLPLASCGGSAALNVCVISCARVEGPASAICSLCAFVQQAFGRGRLSTRLSAPHARLLFPPLTCRSPFHVFS